MTGVIIFLIFGIYFFQFLLDNRALDKWEYLVVNRDNLC